MKRALRLGCGPLTFQDASDFVFGRGEWGRIEISPECFERIEASRARLLDVIHSEQPVYGVTTGFGDSCHRRVSEAHGRELQRNLVRYLLCGTGPELPRAAAKATLLARLQSLCRGLSGVTPALVRQLCALADRDWAPVIPREGSLGASGDLIPLAYLAAAVQGEGDLDTPHGRFPAAELFVREGLSPYRLEAKEGLALVNGTSAMAGMALVNLNQARFLCDLALLSTSWTCLALQGRPEAFGRLVNEIAKAHPGQARAARAIRVSLEDEGYRPSPAKEGMIQDRYSVRCAPQILGPVLDTISMVERWTELEWNGVSDNPLIDTDGAFAMGGNFYGGYLSQGMDYLKISLGQVADLIDRQVALVIDEKSSRGLPPNLADWPGLPEDERHLHHGLKGLHQATSAITSEVLARTMPNSVFSRSTESHNQDKVSLGMSAAVQCGEIVETLFTLSSLQLVCLAQALDLRGVKLRGGGSKKIYDTVRAAIPFVERDTRLDKGIGEVSSRLKEMAAKQGALFSDET